MQTNQLIKQIFEKSNFGGLNNALLNFAEWTALAQKDKYQTEIEYFKNKYKTTFSRFKNTVTSMKNDEDFKKEDDLMDWEFAFNAHHWWNKTLQRI